MLELLDSSQPMINSFLPPSVRPQAALRSNRLARSRVPMPIIEGMSVVFLPEGRLDWEGAGEPVDIAFTVAGEVGYITTVMPVVQRLLAHFDVGVQPDQLDNELMAMVVETVLMERINAMEARLGGEIALIGVDQSRDHGSLASLPFEVRTTDGDAVWPGRIHASTALLALVARHWERQPPINGEIDDLFFTLACRVAFTDLATSAVRALGVGDAMLFDRVAVPGGAAIVVAEALHAIATFDEQGFLYLTEAFRTPERYVLGEFLMSEEDDQDRPVQAITDAAIDELPVRLVFEVGRKDMTLDQLRSLSTGSLVPLDRAASSIVQIFANGRRIGAGEMVMIGEQLGMRITQLNNNA